MAEWEYVDSEWRVAGFFGLGRDLFSCIHFLGELAIHIPVRFSFSAGALQLTALSRIRPDRPTLSFLVFCFRDLPDPFS